MNNVLAILFAMAVLLVLTLGVTSALRDTQLKIDYNQTSARLKQAVSEYVGTACGGGNRPINNGHTIGFNTAATCSGNVVPSLEHNGSPVCAARHEPGYIADGLVKLHGATLELVLDSTPPVLRLEHNDLPEARKFLAYLVGSHEGWLPFENDSDNEPEGVQWLLHTRASAAEGLWLAAAGADTSCTRWGRAREANTHDDLTDSACHGWTRFVRDDKAEECSVFSTALCYDRVSSFTASSSWKYGRDQRYKDEKPEAC